MDTLETLLLAFHVLAALAIIGLVLFQHGKGADMGAGFGAGASATVFGSGGAGNFLTRSTTILAITFFLSSFGLAFFAKEKSTAAAQLGIPTVVEQVPVMEEDAHADHELPAFEVPADDSEIPEG